ncbi:MAG: bifunctional methylenetetrahydrofolate dehydrogenase/methenyltetrahydrofolate cyclohydrolase FolD [Candidatus Dadabacteria bacterium]|nr:MAG: bifunctional methylenetetrahydrofolate dehydrogenase/methenyltetrahydrofolate cyclohydrolase FolD [Candidatus Dadabacteria bacterium]
MEITEKILDGKQLAALFHRAIQNRVDKLSAEKGRPPGLAVILVGDNPASRAYVKTKGKVAKKCGFKTFDYNFPAGVSQQELLSAIHECNRTDEVDGILLQLPLPEGLNSEEALSAINPSKDADGLHPLNQGLLMRGKPPVYPCTPFGVMKLIDLAFSGVALAPELDPLELKEADLSGKHAVIVGRSILVGKPQIFLLLEHNATVSIAHSRTANLKELCSKADILIAAAGVPGLIGAEHIKQGAVVIDVGINRLEDGTLTGDVDFESAYLKASKITPVPGGVGPMTVAMLMHNTLSLWERRVSS